MELEEMKSLWETMSQRVEKLEITNKEQLMEMTKIKYKSKFNKLFTFEFFGTIICFGFAILIIFNLHKMTPWYLMVCSILAIIFFTVIPFMALRAIKNMNKIDFSTSNYKETLQDFARKKKALLLIQKFSSTLSILFGFIAIPVFSMIMNDKDFFTVTHKTSLWVFMAFMAVLMVLFSRWGYGKYKSMANSAEKLLEELKD